MDVAPSPQDDGAPDAQVLPFPGSSERDVVGITKTRWQAPSEQGSWEDLTDALREVTFDGHDWATLAVETEPLLEQIGLKRPPHPLSEEELQNHLNSLQEILNRVLRPGASGAKVRSACRHADLLRGWLLDLLTEPER